LLYFRHAVAQCLGALVRSPTARAIALSAIVQTVFLVVLAATDGYDTARSGEWLRVVLTYTSIAALFALVGCLAGERGRPSGGCRFVVYAAFVIVGFARYETAGSFDYAFAYENVRELATPLGRHIVSSRVRVHEVVLLLALPIAIGGVVLFRWDANAGPRVRPSRRVLGAVACVALLAAPPLLRIATHESLSVFVASGVRFHLESRANAAVADGYPLVREFMPTASAHAVAGDPAQRPDVILLFLESWSAIYTDTHRPDGQPATPVFDAHRREGLTFDHFYASSIQSSRGRFATLCSLVPMLRGKEFKDLAGAPLHCLPHVLAENGYRTLLYSASDEPTFERSEDFLHELGFGEVRFVDPMARGKDPAVWGVGLQDDVFYRRWLAVLDERAAADPDAPLFAVGINASNHYPFDHDPTHVPAAGYGTKYARNYVASLARQDERLATFFDELEKRPRFRDAIIVLVGDHSFPADEHGIHFNGLGAFEESFRTAFAIRWRAHVAPEVVKDRAASQIDIAPSITDLLQIRHTTHFVGRSVFAADDGQTPAPMVQPYDGIRLVAVRWPYKLERHESADQEHLYDLSRDPREEEDRIDDPTLAGELSALRETVLRIRRSQSILASRRVWPRAQHASE